MASASHFFDGMRMDLASRHLLNVERNTFHSPHERGQLDTGSTQTDL